MTTEPKTRKIPAANAAEAGPHRCERCGIPADDGCSVRVSCGLETPALKKLIMDVEAAKDKLDQISLAEFDEDDIARICGLDRYVRENASLVFVYIPRENWPPGAQAAWDAHLSAMAAIEAYSNEPDVPAHLRWQTSRGT